MSLFYYMVEVAGLFSLLAHLSPLTWETYDCLSPCCSQVLHSHMRPDAALQQYNMKKPCEFNLLSNFQTTPDSCVFIWEDTGREVWILTIFAEDWRGDQVLEDPSVSVERTNHLTPNQELAHLLCQLPQFLLRHKENRTDSINHETRFTKSIWLAHTDPQKTI